MIVPTVERGFRPDDFCEIEIDGLRSAEEIDIRLRHLAEKLPGERRKTLDIPPLSFGVDRVERERAFPRPGNTGQANELISRQA